MSIKVIEKITKVMEIVQFLKKDGSVAFGNTKYKYLSEGKITENIREACLKVGLVIIPHKTEHIESNTNTMAKVKIIYRVYDKESGEFLEGEMIGYGSDAGDKSIYKGITGAYKYFQRQLFAIPTNETDPDKISSDEVEEEIRKMQEEQNKQFEQAVKEMEESKGQEAPPPPKKDNKKLEPFQAVYALATKKGMTQAQVKAWAKKAFDLKVDEDKVSLKTMSKEQLDKITAALNKYPDKKGDK